MARPTAKNKVVSPALPSEEAPHVESPTLSDLAWVNIEHPGEAEIRHLPDSYHFNSVTLKDYPGRKQLPKLDMYPGYPFFITREPQTPDARFRGCLANIDNKIKRFSTTDGTCHYSTLMNHMKKVCETLGEAREPIEVCKDANTTLATCHVNATLRVLIIMEAMPYYFHRKRFT